MTLLVSDVTLSMALRAALRMDTVFSVRPDPVGGVCKVGMGRVRQMLAGGPCFAYHPLSSADASFEAERDSR
jgi:hypothetical protein